MDPRRNLPKVDTLMADEALAAYPEKVRAHAARRAIERARAAISRGETVDVKALAAIEAEARDRASLGPVVNLSGVILHTGLGRARLAEPVAEHVAKVALDYSDLEFDLEDGTRGDRQQHVRDLLCELTGAADALVVNNAAASVLLSLSAFCAGRDVLLSRGQMVEIGGSFRMPDIVRQSGCRLVEVGCTNRTHLRDYAERIGPETGAILRCHPSNYRVVGFVSEPALAELRQLADDAGTSLLDDQGNGCLIDLTRFGVPDQPTLPESVAHATLSMASGDKLLGGPQSGLIVGDSAAIQELKRHPLARALRVDKLTIAALEATLRLYARGEELQIPVLRDLAKPLEDVRRDAERLAGAWPGSVVEPSVTEVGSGSAPGTGVPTWRVGLPGNASEVSRALRRGKPAIVGRIEGGRVWLDPRSADRADLASAEVRIKELAR